MRSHLTDIIIDIVVSDVLDISEDEVFINESLEGDDELRLTGSLKYDGTGQHNGVWDYSGDSDTVTITP